MSEEEGINSMEATAVAYNDSPRLWDEKETARYLGLSVEFLQRDRLKLRRVPFIKIGYAVRYDPDDVKAFAQSCKVTAASQASSNG